MLVLGTIPELPGKALGTRYVHGADFFCGMSPYLYVRDLRPGSVTCIARGHID
jgi:hypothetical protein